MTTKAQFPREQTEEGEFERQEDTFREWVTTGESSPYPAVAGRYHLYISLACPWACRALIVRNLKKLQETIGVTVVDPIRDERGWAFGENPGRDRDAITGFSFLKEAYLATEPSYEGRVTVPVLWDKETGKIVNNSEDDICRMFNRAFDAFGDRSVDLFPEDIEEEHSRLSEFIYEKINNGVYKAGFASAQQAYEAAARELFAALDKAEERLATQRYLFGERIVEVDWRLFCTLVRFDPLYYSHFKCNVRLIRDYPNLQGYPQDLYQQPGIAETVDFDQIKRHYYITQDEINPSRIVPIGPGIDLRGAHGRERLG